MTTPTHSRAWRLDDPRRKKQADKRLTLLKAARAVFLEEGFLGTSMQAVADRAGVSKMTLYRHFPDKDELFQAMFFEQCLAWRQTRPLKPAKDLGEARSVLRAYAAAFFHTITRPDVLLLYRMLVGEINRFPPLGQAFYDYGPRQEIADIEGVLTGMMPAREARPKAEAFFYLTMGHTYHQILLGCLAPEEGLKRYQAELRTALRLVLGEPEGTNPRASRRKPRT
jgi:TetR/AcrR family transcriptional regulator, mexJK operon transcriptional repressor